LEGKYFRVSRIGLLGSNHDRSNSHKFFEKDLEAIWHCLIKKPGELPPG
jgi:hypothetical protein